MVGSLVTILYKPLVKLAYYDLRLLESTIANIQRKVAMILYYGKHFMYFL